MADMAGNYLSGISPRSARIVDEFVPDTIQPELLSFDADMVAIHTYIHTYIHTFIH